MKNKVSLILRLLLGAALTFFGANSLFQFIPMQPEGLPEKMQNAMTLFGGTGYMTVIGVIKVLAGLCLLANKYTALAITFAVAVLFNALLFHVFFETLVGGTMAVLFLLISFAIVYLEKEKFACLFKA